MHAGGRTITTGFGQLPVAASIYWAGIAVVVGMATWLQLRAYLNHDVAWVAWGARAMLDGARFGRDIIEPNPPLAWWLAMPPALAAAALRLPLALAGQLWVLLLAFGSLAACWRLTPPAARPRAWPRLAVATLFLLLLCHRDFGQREHLAVILLLPWLTLTARRLDGGAAPLAVAVAVGVAAGLGIALKPYFLAVLLLVELAAAARARHWRVALRPETLTLLATGVAYLAAVALLTPDYLRTAMPLARTIYWSFDRPAALLWSVLWLPVLALAALVALPAVRASAVAMLGVAASAGFVVAALVQHKAYSYHLLPATALAALAAAAACGAAGRQRAAAVAVLGALLATSAAPTLRWARDNAPDGHRSRDVAALIATFDAAPGGGFLAVAVHPHPGFPAGAYARGAWVSRTNSQWFLPAVAQLRASRRDPAGLAVAERHARAFIAHDLARRPGVVLIDTDAARHTVGPRDFDILAFYAEDPAFRRAFAAYRETGRIAGFRRFVRTGR